MLEALGAVGWTAESVDRMGAGKLSGTLLSFSSAPLMVERFNVQVVQPQVQILTPALRPRRGDAQGMLPHVYYRPDGQVILCMLDPDSDEWSPSDLPAETTVPWVTDWLVAYEGWRATGEWTGTGRHLEPA